MNRTEIFLAVQQVVAESLSMEAEEIWEHHELTKDLGVDSGDYLDIIARLDQRFGIPRPSGKLEQRSAIAFFSTIGDICEYAERQLERQGRFVRHENREPVLA